MILFIDYLINGFDYLISKQLNLLGVHVGIVS